MRKKNIYFSFEGFWTAKKFKIYSELLFTTNYNILTVSSRSYAPEVKVLNHDITPWANPKKGGGDLDPGDKSHLFIF